MVVTRCHSYTEVSLNENKRTKTVFKDLNNIQNKHKGHSLKSPCQIKFPFSSNYISVFYEQIISGVGCSTNGTTVRHEEVHVIDLLNAGPILRNDVGEVHLMIKSRNDEVLWKEPSIFILNSHQPVRWKVKMEILATKKIKHIFVVPRHSGVKLMKGQVRSRGKVRKVDNFPTKRDELLRWSLEEYGVVTSFTELKRGNRIVLEVGLDKDSPMECHIKDAPQTLNAVAKYEQPQILSGCIVPARTDLLSSDRVAFVIELTRVQTHPNKKTTIEVELDIKGERRRTMQRDFWLVLKSPSHVNWKVRTRKIQGYIDIIANTFVDMTDIRMDTVGVRTEDMTDTGQDLIKWVEYYIGPVAMYTGIDLANKIKLILPDADPSGEKKGPVRVVIDPFEQPDDTKAVFKKVVHSECHPSSGLTVAISKAIIRNFALMTDQITFLSPSCKATENSTHIVLETTPASCKTRLVEKHGKGYFTNKIVIHQTKISNDVIERGSGDDSIGNHGDDDEEISGSGSHDPMTETYIDDEDFGSAVIKIDVACEIRNGDISIDPEQTSQVLPSITPYDFENLVNFKLELFESGSYREPIKGFPVTVQVNDRVYAQATITADKDLRVQVHSCWLSPYMDRQDFNHHPLLEHGCIKDSSFSWHPVSTMSQYQQFSFIPRNKFQFVFLKCQLTVCKHGASTEHYTIPQCIHNPDEYCQLASSADRSGSRVPSRVEVFGPIQLQKTRFIPERRTTTSTKKPDVKTNKPDKEPPKTPEKQNRETIIIGGLDSGTVVGIAFAAFIIGIILMAALWFIHTHTGPIKHAVASRGGLDLSGESTPSSTAPIHT